MDCAYKLTTNGRAVMAACMVAEKPFHITRAAFGSGRVDENVNLADVHQLLAYVSDGAVTDYRHQDDRFEFTLQFANSEHPGVKTFLLSEFMVFVEDPMTGEETDLLYGTLGDYRQPVPAYNPAYPPAVFNLPLMLVFSSEIEVSVTASPGLVTYDDLAKCIAAHNADPEAHEDIRAKINSAMTAIENTEVTVAGIDARLILLELMYRTQVSGNPFVVTFESLDGLAVTGVWNAAQKRIEF